MTLWDNLLEGRVDAGAFLDAALRALPRETDEQNTQRILGYVDTRVLAVPAAGRSGVARAPALEAMLRAGLDARRRRTSQKSAWFNAFRDDGADARRPGLARARLAARGEDRRASRSPSPTRSRWRWSWPCAKCRAGSEILQTQLERTQNPDRKARFAFVMPALSADPQVREQAFARFRSSRTGAASRGCSSRCST